MKTYSRTCTGITASWCPNHGNCCCEIGPDGTRSLDDHNCPLHAPNSHHGEIYVDEFSGSDEIALAHSALADLIQMVESVGSTLPLETKLRLRFNDRLDRARRVLAVPGR
jgi:hypothetical protein